MVLVLVKSWYWKMSSNGHFAQKPLTSQVWCWVWCVCFQVLWRREAVKNNIFTQVCSSWEFLWSPFYFNVAGQLMEFVIGWWDFYGSLWGHHFEIFVGFWLVTMRTPYFNFVEQLMRFLMGLWDFDGTSRPHHISILQDCLWDFSWPQSSGPTGDSSSSPPPIFHVELAKR